MAKSDSQRKVVLSDPGTNGEDDSSLNGSSDSSIKSSPTKSMDSRPNDLLGKESPIKDRSFPINFAELFKKQNPCPKDGSCQYLKPNEDSILVIEEEDTYRVEDMCRHCLLGFFAGRFPVLKAVRSLVDKWNSECEILPHQSGWVIFKFQDKAKLERVLAGGPYFIYGRTLLLHSIPENFCFQEEDYSIVPSWVQLHNLPLQCWNMRAISRIASKLGKPLCVDSITLERKRIYYARVLIEMDTAVKPLEEFEVKLPSGVVYTQYVLYENFPKFCNHFFMFGNLKENCRHLKVPITDSKKSDRPLEKTTPVVVSQTPNSADKQDSLETPSLRPWEEAEPNHTCANKYALNTSLVKLPANDAAPTTATVTNTSEGSIVPLSDEQLEEDDEGFQKVQSKRNKGKIHVLSSSDSNLHIALNTRQFVRAGIAKYAAIRVIPNSGMDKSNQSD